MGHVREQDIEREQGQPGGSHVGLARLAANACGTPLALVHMYDACNARYESQFGLEMRMAPDAAFSAVDAHSLLVVPDARDDIRFANNPLVTGPPWVRSVAGVRIDSPAGRPLGVVYAMDTVARDFSCEQLSLLREAACLLSRVLQHEHELTDRVARASLHDALTGLPNRVLLADRLTSALHRAERSGSDVAVLFCNLDGFKHVNEISGHLIGDGVLMATAARLSAELRPQDTIARVCGDEFVIVLEPPLRAMTNGLSAPTDGSDPRIDALAVAARLKEVLAEPLEIDDREHVITASIGIAFARQGDTAEDALRDADSAMYSAKALGKDRCEVFDDHLRVEAVERGRVEQLLRAALALRVDPARLAGDPYRCPAPQLWVAYQPIMNLQTSQVCGVEALARLTDGQRRPISPEEFIPIAEETGLIAPLGQYVLEQACRDLAGWRHHTPLGVSVNLSARQAGLPGLVEQVESTLQVTGVAPEQLTLELTETALLQAGRSTMSALQDLRALGVKISIDDFGTGYASLRYLTELPVTGVKVDRSFTMGLPDDPTSNAIVQSVAGLARELSLSCVVEGIETVEQLQALPRGVLGQGFLLGRPAPACETARLLHSLPRIP